MILHGEQEFVYHRWPKVGDLLEGHRTISDVYERDTSSAAWSLRDGDRGA